MNFERGIDPKESLNVGLSNRAIPIKRLIDMRYTKIGRISNRITKKSLHKYLRDLSNCKMTLRSIKEGYYALAHPWDGGQIHHTVPILMAGSVLSYQGKFYIIPSLEDPRWKYAIDHFQKISPNIDWEYAVRTGCNLLSDQTP